MGKRGRWLFLLLASRANVKVATQQDLDTIPKIVAWLQGHPLALILMVPLAANTRMMISTTAMPT